MSVKKVKGNWSLFLLAGVLTLGLVAWKEEQSIQTKNNYTDTVPRNREKKIRNLDDALQEIDKSELELEQSMKKIEKELAVPPLPPTPPVDIEKAMAEVDKAMKDINPEKIKQEIEASLKDIDIESMKNNMAKALKDIDAEKMKAQLSASLAKVDMEKVKQEMERMKEEMPKLQEKMKNIKPEVEASMKKAKEGIEKARTEIKEFKTFEEGLEKDGLINRKSGYVIEHKEGKLSINGTPQPDAVYNKYRSFLEKHKSFKLINYHRCSSFI